MWWASRGGVEWVNARFNPLDLRRDGWSFSTFTEVQHGSYDRPLERLAKQACPLPPGDGGPGTARALAPGGDGVAAAVTVVM